MISQLRLAVIAALACVCSFTVCNDVNAQLLKFRRSCNSRCPQPRCCPQPTYSPPSLPVVPNVEVLPPSESAIRTTKYCPEGSGQKEYNTATACCCRHYEGNKLVYEVVSKNPGTSCSSACFHSISMNEFPPIAQRAVTFHPYTMHNPSEYLASSRPSHTKSNSTLDDDPSRCHWRGWYKCSDNLPWFHFWGNGNDCGEAMEAAMDEAEDRCDGSAIYDFTETDCQCDD